MSAPSTRVVWRVLVASSDYTRHTEDWFDSATCAFLYASAAEKNGAEEIEVNRCVLKPRLTRIQILNRAQIVESSSVIRPEVWRRPLRRHTRRGGAA